MEVKWWERQYLRQTASVLASGYPDQCWTEGDVRAFVNDTRNVCKVLVDKSDRVWGVVLYTVDVNSCRVRRLAVHHLRRRRGLATLMLRALTGPLGTSGRRDVVAGVHERDLTAQRLFRKAGFTVDAAQPRRKDDKGEDVYLFTFVKPEPLVLAARGR